MGIEIPKCVIVSHTPCPECHKRFELNEKGLSDLVNHMAEQHNQIVVSIGLQISGFSLSKRPRHSAPTYIAQSHSVQEGN